VDDFDACYAAHYRSLTVQLYAYFGDRQEAQDVVQEAFCRAFAHWPRICRYDDPVAWIRRVAWNLATTRWRRLRVARRYAAMRGPEQTAAEPGPDRVALARALATLPPPQRRAVIQHYIADQPIDVIAREAGVPVGTVKSWLHRARTALATQLTSTEEGR
jgi:RNA polymerase sigma-70 factor, ECF subfamily